MNHVMLLVNCVVYIVLLWFSWPNQWLLLALFRVGFGIIKVSKYCTNRRGSLLLNLWALWGANVDFVVRVASSQCVVLEYICNNHEVYIAGIYASTNYLHRRELWSDFTALQNLC
jgi:hypothetical protein